MTRPGLPTTPSGEPTGLARARARGGTSTTTASSAATRVPQAPRPAPLPKTLTCPICQTAFDPRASAGRCPVCGEQVVPAVAATREVPGLSRLGRWLKSGGWRLVLVFLLVLYQIVLFVYLWHLFVVNHLL